MALTYAERIRLTRLIASAGVSLRAAARDLEDDALAVPVIASLHRCVDALQLLLHDAPFTPEDAALLDSTIKRALGVEVDAATAARYTDRLRRSAT